MEIHFLSIVDYSDCPFGNAHLAFDDSVGCSCVGLLWNHSSISFISSYFYLPVFRSDFCCCYAILGFVSVTRSVVCLGMYSYIEISAALFFWFKLTVVI